MKIFVVVDGDNCKTPLRPFVLGTGRVLCDRSATNHILQLVVIRKGLIRLPNIYFERLHSHSVGECWSELVLDDIYFGLKLDHEYLTQSPEKML